ncbi:hypothetical protein [Microviridae sp.]|nr:hypothetical protein [Microviridae sp.]
MYDSQQNYTTQRLGQQREHDYRMANQNRRHDKVMAKNSTKWQFDQLMNSADESGIHRLAALGGASGYQGTATGPSGGGTGSISIPGGSAGHKSNLIGDAIGEGINAFRQSRELKMAEKESSARVKLLNAEAAQIDEATSRSTIRNARAGATSGSNNSPVGSRDNPLQTHVWGKDPRSGKEGWMLNPDLPDIEQLPIAEGAEKVWTESPHTNARPLTMEEYQVLKKPPKIQTKKLKKGAAVPSHFQRN